MKGCSYPSPNAKRRVGVGARGEGGEDRYASPGRGLVDLLGMRAGGTDAYAKQALFFSRV